MKFEILNRFTGKVIFEKDAESMRLTLEAAVEARADLSGAYLYGADLSGAYLSGAYLSGADLSGADLYGADLSGAYLYGANLYGAYLDMASWPLSCGGTRAKVHRRISLQLIYHAFNQVHDDPEILAALEPLRALAEEFRGKHRTDAPPLREVVR